MEVNAHYTIQIRLIELPTLNNCLNISCVDFISFQFWEAPLEENLEFEAVTLVHLAL